MANRQQKRSRAQRANKAKGRRGAKISHPPADVVGKPRTATETSLRALAVGGASGPVAASPTGHGKRERITVRLAADLFLRAKNVAKSTPGVTLAGLAVEAIRKHLDDLERQGNEPVPSPKGDESET